MNFKKILLIAVAVLMTATASVGAKRQPAIFNKVDKKAMESWVNSTFKSLSPDERIAQLIVMAENPRGADAETLVKK